MPNNMKPSYQDNATVYSRRLNGWPKANYR